MDLFLGQKSSESLQKKHLGFGVDLLIVGLELEPSFPLQCDMSYESSYCLHC